MNRGRSFTEFKILFWITQAVGLLALSFICIWVFSYRYGVAWNSHPKQQFNWHVLCMTFGMIYLSANGILVYRALRYMKHVSLKRLHAGFAGVIIIFVIIGYWAILDSHNYQDKPNWFSLHSWMGILSTLLLLFQGILGALAFLWPLLGLHFVIQYQPVHTFLGLTTLVMSSATALLGLFEEIENDTGYTTFRSPGVMMNICGLLIATFTILVVYLETQGQFKRRPLECD